MPRSKILRVCGSLLSDWRMTAQFCADSRSRLRLGADFLLSRFANLLPGSVRARVHHVRFRDGVHICYRVNKGDLHSIREIWFEKAYRLPFDARAGALLDLGANIGMTSVWLSRNYPFTETVAVEPDPRNAALLRRNLELNGINARVVEAAIGPREGAAHFAFNESSNVGHISDGGAEVPMTSVNALSQKLGVAEWALIKIDIEGGEANLLESNTDWLNRARAIIIELHPQVVDCAAVIEKIVSRGWTYVPAGSAFPDNMDSFIRIEKS